MEGFQFWLNQEEAAGQGCSQTLPRDSLHLEAEPEHLLTGARSQATAVYRTCVSGAINSPAAETWRKMNQPLPRPAQAQPSIIWAAPPACWSPQVTRKGVAYKAG